jgi:Flp pilus assembly pilin Flp
MFKSLIAQFWADEAGAVIATEYLMLGSIVAAGSTTGLVAMRDAMVSEYQEFGDSVKDIRKAYGVNLPKSKARPITSTYDPTPLTGDGFTDHHFAPVYPQYASVSP